MTIFHLLCVTSLYSDNCQFPISGGVCVLLTGSGRRALEQRGVGGGARVASGLLAHRARNRAPRRTLQRGAARHACGGVVICCWYRRLESSPATSYDAIQIHVGGCRGEPARGSGSGSRHRLSPCRRITVEKLRQPKHYKAKPDCRRTRNHEAIGFEGGPGDTLGETLRYRQERRSVGLWGRIQCDLSCRTCPLLESRWRLQAECPCYLRPPP